MRSLLITGLIVVFLSACTSEPLLSSEDQKRASDLNAQLGLGYLKQGQYKRAKKKLDKAIKFNSDNPSAYHYLAELYRRIDENDKARENYLHALQLDPENQNIKNNYGVFLCDVGDYQKGIQVFDKLLDDPLATGKDSVYENVGLCRLKQGRLNDAEKAFKDALAINPKLPKSLLNLAQLRYDIGLNQEAYRLYGKYTSVAPQTPESLWLGILLETDRGAKNTVASYKVKLKGKFPDSPQTRLLLKMEREGKL